MSSPAAVPSSRPAPPRLTVRGLVKDFAGRRGARPSGPSTMSTSTSATGEFVCLDRRVGLRQVDAAEHRRRARVRHRRRGRGRRRTGRRPRTRPGDGVPGVLAVPVEDGRRQHRVRARTRRRGRAPNVVSASKNCSGSWSSPHSPTTCRSSCPAGCASGSPSPGRSRPQPDVLLLDEPFGALDAITKRSMQEFIRTVWLRTGVTILMVTHDVAEAIYLSQRIYVMTPRPGRVATTIDVPFGAVRGPVREARCPLPRPASTRSRTCCRRDPRRSAT